MIRRLFAWIDRLATRHLDRHLIAAGILPERRDGLNLTLAHSGKPVTVDALTRWRETRDIPARTDVWSCCKHCPPICVDIHRDACPMPECADAS